MFLTNFGVPGGSFLVARIRKQNKITVNILFIGFIYYVIYHIFKQEPRGSKDATFFLFLPSSFLSFSFLDATTHLYKRSFRSVRLSVCPSVRPLLFSNDEKRHFPFSDDNEIRQGPRESQGQLKNDIRMSVRQSVCPSDAKKKKRKKRKK